MKSLLILLISLWLAPFTWSLTKVEEGERLTIELYGVSFEQPDGWFIVNQADIVANLGKLDQEKENIQKLLQSVRGSMMIGGYYKYDPATHPGVIPTIQVHVRLNPMGEGPRFFDFIEKSLEQVKAVLNNFKTTEALQWVELNGGKRALKSTNEFDMLTGGGITSRIISTTYAIPFQGAFIQVSMSESEPREGEKEFAAFIDSFHLTE